MMPASPPPAHACHVAAECMKDGAAIRLALAKARRRRGELRRAEGLEAEAEALEAAAGYLAQLARQGAP